MRARKQTLTGSALRLLRLPAPVLAPCLCFCCALLRLAFHPTVSICLSESCVLFKTQLRCLLLQDGAPDFSLSAPPCPLPPSPGCTSALSALEQMWLFLWLLNWAEASSQRGTMPLDKQV